MQRLSFLLNLILLGLILCACQPVTNPAVTPTARPAQTITASPTVKNTATAVVVQATNTPSSQENPNLSGWLVYYSDQDGDSEIYLVNLGEKDFQPIPLTSNSIEDSAPALAPDHRTIVFISDRLDPNAGNCDPFCFTQLFTIQNDGSAEQQYLETDFPVQHPAWSPDGLWISFDSEVNLSGDIYIVKKDGSELRKIIEDGFWADWSPDGNNLVFASKRDGNLELYTAALDGTNVERLTNNTEMDIFPAWSPDGEKLAFMRMSSQGTQIYVLNLNTGIETQITQNGKINEDPDWSPDGNQIIFQSNRDGNFELYVVSSPNQFTDAEQLTETRLTNHQAEDFWPSWVED